MTAHSSADVTAGSLATAPRTFGRFFLPGPTEVRPRILDAMRQPMIGHRGKGMEERAYQLLKEDISYAQLKKKLPRGGFFLSFSWRWGWTA